MNLRPAIPGDAKDAAARRQLIARARQQRAEVAQYFTDIASWNDNARAPGEEPIDPDPDGTLSCLIAYLDHVLEGEA